ncbi:MAG: DNA repair exonuclease [Synechococcales bacterium]|nr:DNA repair exonuclease [Synechococcales bacterium]
MPKFLHIADIHLGFDHYDNRDRTKDFYRALEDVLLKYAVREPVDFVIIAGDLFEHRTIQPAILNQAKTCLMYLQEAGIPVIAIEGNHDNRPYGTVTNWLKYLADDSLLILLEPEAIDGQVRYEPWDADYRSGGYIDLPCGVRVVGSQWYGSSAPKMIQTLADAIAALPSHPGQTIMLLHHGLEGQIARYQGALRYNDLLPLQQAGVDYLALGHIHKSYVEQGWIFNPGSLEANSVEESTYDRGALLVEFIDQQIKWELKQDYYQRQIIRLKLKTKGNELVDELQNAAIALVENAIQTTKIQVEHQPIVELRIEGTVGFDRLDLDTRRLQQELQQLTGALIFLLRYNVESLTFESPIAPDANRSHIEQEVFLDCLTAHNSYKNRANLLSQGLIELKDKCLQGDPEEALYDFVQELLAQELLA